MNRSWVIKRYIVSSVKLWTSTLSTHTSGKSSWIIGIEGMHPIDISLMHTSPIEITSPIWSVWNFELFACSATCRFFDSSLNHHGCYPTAYEKPEDKGLLGDSQEGLVPRWVPCCHHRKWPGDNDGRIREELRGGFQEKHVLSDVFKLLSWK